MRIYSYIDKNKKRDKYSDLMLKLKNSVEEKFYYESIFIIFAILEDRTESLLKHANINTLRNDNQKLSLSEKLDKIRNSGPFQDEYIKRHLTSTLIKQIYDWKNKRNLLMHNLINLEYCNYEIEELALDVYELIKLFNNKSTLVNKYNDSIKLNDAKGQKYDRRGMFE